jgi:hypothetical protein
MFSSEQYRAKAAEYKERGRKTDAPNESREFSNLQRTFTEMADNEEWVEKNHQHIVHAGNDPKGSASFAAEEEHILRHLGAAVIMHWSSLPKKLQRQLFDAAGATGDLSRTKTLRTQLARFLHKHK